MESLCSEIPLGSFRMRQTFSGEQVVVASDAALNVVSALTCREGLLLLSRQFRTGFSLAGCEFRCGCVFPFLCRAEVGTIFALSWLITWFGHVLPDFRQVVRLHDFFLACHPLMPIYFAAVVSIAHCNTENRIKPEFRICITSKDQRGRGSFFSTGCLAPCRELGFLGFIP